MDESILTKPLHQLTTTDLREIGFVADSLFARLLRPFMQSRLEYVFSVPATIRQTMRTGHILPQYERVEKKHRKSNIIIALSISGIDRCFGCGMLRLLSELRRFISFKLFIYTDTCVEATFTQDGFLANDHMLAWNNVYAPLAWSHLDSLLEEKQGRGESQLLIIDSLGGADSGWYNYVSQDMLGQVIEVQNRYMGGKWQQARQWLNGRYELFDTIPRSYQPPGLMELVEHNTTTRWVNAPALREYLVRWVMNPSFGTHQHAQRFDDDSWNHRSLYYDTVIPKLRERFGKIHIVMPTQTSEGMQTLDWLIAQRFIDFHHRIDSLEGFAAMMFNIAHNRETNRVRVAEIQFSSFVMKMIKEKTDDDDPDGDDNHSEISLTGEVCFSKIPDERDWVPPCQYFVEDRKRGTEILDKRFFTFSELDFGHNAMSVLEVFNLFDWKVEPYWTDFSRREKAESILHTIQTYQMAGLEGIAGVRLVQRKADPDNWREEWINQIDYAGTTKQATINHLRDWVALLSPAYRHDLILCPLRHVIWCSVAKFNARKVGISVTPGDNLMRREDVWHELGHYLAHGSPVVGAYTNNVFELMTGKVVTTVRVGTAITKATVPPYKPWIAPYAGKWYARHATGLPNPDEVLSVHSEYFTTTDKLVELLEHDPLMVKICAFVFMGGPAALLASLQDVKRRDALTNIAQRAERAVSSGGVKDKQTRVRTRYVRVRLSKKADEYRSPGL